MKLHADRVLRTHERREGRASVSAPRANACDIDWVADIAICIVGDRQGRDIEERVVRFLDGIPSDLGNAFAFELANASGKDAESVAGAFVAGIEEELHAEADAETWESGVERGAHGVAPGREARRGVAECADAGKHEHVGVAGGERRVGLRLHSATISRERLEERMEVPCPVVEDGHLHCATASRSAASAVSIMGQGPIVMRTPSPTPCTAGNGRTATPAARMRAVTTAASKTGTKTKFAVEASGCILRARSASMNLARLTIALCAFSRIQSMSSRRAASAARSAAAPIMYGPRAFSMARINGAAPVA